MSRSRARMGTDVERNFVRNLWKKGIPAIRLPASGAATGMPRPDVLAFLNGEIICIEIKTSSKDKAIYRWEDWKNAYELSRLISRQGIKSSAYIVFHPKRSKKYIWISITQEAYEKNMKLIIEKKENKWAYHWEEP